MGGNTLNYEEIIQDLVSTGSDELISNSDTNHAKVLIRYLFKTSRNRICIFSSQLNDHIYDDDEVISEIERFVEKDGQVEILLQQPGDFDKSRKIFKLMREFKNRISVKSVTNITDSEIDPHFVVNDNNGFRFCEDKKKTSAIASFNRAKTAKNLIEQFDILFKRAQEFSRA